MRLVAIDDTPAMNDVTSSTVATTAGDSDGERRDRGSADGDAMFAAGNASRYQLGAERGRGGLGRVTEAVDRQLGRRVAIKELHVLSGEARARFAREVALTAALEHPAIVPVYDAGSWPGGEPYYAMRLVDGRPLSDAIAARATLAERLALLPQVISVVDAIAYAHSKGVLHRDLKPSNVVLGAYGEAVVIDWGLAKNIGEQAAAITPSAVTPSGSDLTEDGAVMGSAPYMPPEQAGGTLADPRADVYALGALLYELIAGRPPYDGKDRRQVLAQLIAGAPPPLASRVDGVPPELAAIVARAMAREPEQRYPRAGELADDLRRFSAGQLVSAHRYSAASRVWRWMGRHWVAVRVGAVALAIVAAIGVIAALRVRDERDRAAEAGARAAAIGNSLRVEQARAALIADPTAAAAWLMTWTPTPDGLPVAARIAADAVEQGVARHVLTMPRAAAKGVCVAPDGRRAATIDRDGAVAVWDLDAGTSTAISGAVPRPVVCRWFAGGAWLAVRGARGELAVGRVADGALRTLDGVKAQWFEPDAPGGRLAVVAGDGTASLIDPATGVATPLAPAPGKSAVLDVEPTSGTIAIDGPEGIVVWRDPAQPGRRLDGVRARAGHLLVTSDGARIAIADLDGLTVIELATGARAHLAQPWSDGAIVKMVWIDGERALAFVDSSSLVLRRWTPGGDPPEALGEQVQYDVLDRSADGEVLAWADRLGAIHVLDLATGQRRRLLGHGGALRRVALAPDGRVVVSTGDDGALRVWDVPRRGAALRGHRGLVTTIARVPGALVSAATDAVRVWRDDGALAASLPLTADDTVAVSADGARVVRGGATGALAIWEPATGATRALQASGAAIVRIKDVDRDTIVTAEDGGAVRLWDVASARATVIAEHPNMPLGVTASPDGRWIASVGFDEGVRVYDRQAATSRTLGDQMVWTVAFDAASRSVATGAADGTVAVYALDTGEPRAFAAHRGRVTRVAFTPDGATVISGDDAGGLVVWRLATDERIPLRGHDAEITALAIEHDGARVASADLRGELRVWELDTSAVARLDVTGPVRALAFDRGTLVVGADAGALVRFALDGLAAPATDALPAWLSERTRARIVERDDQLGPQTSSAF